MKIAGADIGKASVACMVAIINCPNNVNTHEYLLSKDLRLLSMLMETFHRSNDDMKHSICMGLNNLALKQWSREVMLEEHVPEFVVSVLQKDETNAKDWKGNDHQTYLITFLCAFYIFFV